MESTVDPWRQAPPAEFLLAECTYEVFPGKREKIHLFVRQSYAAAIKQSLADGVGGLGLPRPAA